MVRWLCRVLLYAHWKGDIFLSVGCSGYLTPSDRHTPYYKQRAASSHLLDLLSLSRCILPFSYGLLFIWFAFSSHPSVGPTDRLKQLAYMAFGTAGLCVLSHHSALFLIDMREGNLLRECALSSDKKHIEIHCVIQSNCFVRFL